MGIGDWPTHSITVCPWPKQPGRSGNSAQYPPSPSGLTTAQYIIFAISLLPSTRCPCDRGPRRGGASPPRRLLDPRVNRLGQLLPPRVDGDEDCASGLAEVHVVTLAGPHDPTVADQPRHHLARVSALAKLLRHLASFVIRFSMA